MSQSCSAGGDEGEPDSDSTKKGKRKRRKMFSETKVPDLASGASLSIPFDFEDKLTLTEKMQSAAECVN